MKKNFAIAVLAGGLALTSLLAGCKNNGQNDGGTLATRRPISDTLGTLTPISPQRGFVGEKNDEGELLCDASIFRGNYKAGLTAPMYFIVNDPEQLEREGLSGGASMEKYDEEYFKERAVVVAVMPYSTGSVQIELSSVQLSDGVTAIWLTSACGEVTTEDMATFYAVIGLDKETFGEDIKVRMMLNGANVKQRQNDKVEEK